MKLYIHDLSGHSHRVRLMASLLGLKPQTVRVDLLAGAHKESEFLQRNPFGQVPVLEDEGITLHDSNAILVYLAARYDLDRHWYPTDPEIQARIQIWLSKAANEVAHGPAAARLVTVFNAGYDHKAVIEQAHAFLRILNAELDGKDWIVGSGPSIADVALYSYLAHAPEGGVDLRPYVAVGNWLQRIEALPGFVAMQRTATDAQAALAA